MMNKREFDRQSLRAQCTVRYVAPDGKSVLETVGATHDVSRGGIGIVAKLSLRRQTPVHLSVIGPEGKVTILTGEVKFSKLIERNVYLIGVQFRALDDDRLTPASEPTHACDSAAPSFEQEPGVGGK